MSHNDESSSNANKLAEQNDPVGVGPKVRLVAGRYQVGVTLAPTERPAGRVGVGAEVIERPIALAAEQMADGPIDADIRPVIRPGGLRSASRRPSCRSSTPCAAGWP